MAVTVNNATSTTVATGNATITGNAPTSIAVGDLLLAFVMGQGANPVTPPAGWSSIITSPGFGNLFYKPVTAAQPTTFAFGLSATTSPAACVIALVKGLSGPFGFEGTVGTATGTPATSFVMPTLTTTKIATELLMSFYFNATATAITVPGGQTPIGSVNANGVSMIIGYETLAAVGATGTRTATGGSAAWAAFGIAIVPAIAAIATGTVAVSPPVRAITGWWALASSIAVTGRDTPVATRPLPQWEIDPSGTEMAQRLSTSGNSNDGTGAFLTIDVSGTLSGIGIVGTVPTAGIMVEVLWRESGALIARTFTAADGSWSVSGLRVGYAGYTVIYRAPSTIYNDLVFDSPLPV